MIDSSFAPTADRAVEDLRTLLRFDTTNPPGNEEAAIAFLRTRLEAAGVDVQVLSCEGRPNLVARIAGDGTGGGPLLLAGHVDVVPVDREHWTEDPFAATIRDGYLYGRGAVDMKYMVIHCLYAMLLVAESGRRPSRDLIFAAVSDEEAGCWHGSRFLVDEHPELVRAEHMIGEFGGFSLDVNGVRYYTIQVGEKGVCQFRLRATGEPGHGSIPHSENAVVRIAEAVRKLGNARLPQKPNRTVETFLREMARHQPAPARHVLPLLLNPLTSPLVLAKLIPDRSVANTMAAYLANTVTPTMLEAGEHRNVIPSSASAVFDGRLLPGQTQEDFFAEIRKVIGPGFTFETISYAPGRENANFEADPVYRAIRSTIQAADPGGIPLPYLLTGFTDAREFGRLGMACYGYAPVRFPVEDDIKFQKLVHGHDERIHVDGFRWGLQTFWSLIQDLTGLAR